MDTIAELVTLLAESIRKEERQRGLKEAAEVKIDYINRERDKLQGKVKGLEIDNKTLQDEKDGILN